MYPEKLAKEALSRGWNRFFIRIFEILIFGAFSDSCEKFSFLSGFDHVKIRFFYPFSVIVPKILLGWHMVEEQLTAVQGHRR